MEKVRIDKWLWSIRIFKSRTLATDACKGGKVKIGGDSVKPSYLVARGETVVCRKDGFNFEYKVIDLIEKRVGAPIAVTCYEDITPESEKNKYQAWFENNQQQSAEARERGSGRPTKKERRDIEKYKL
jgi:ribosome-associated heat shock protein Hsp15